MGDVSINEGETKCVHCESTGVTQIACSICKEKGFCNVCENEVMSTRKSTFERWGGEELMGRFCTSCFIEERDKVFDAICLHCKVYYDSAIDQSGLKRNFRGDYGFVPNPLHCVICQLSSSSVYGWEYLIKNPQGGGTPNTYRPHLEEAMRKWNEYKNTVKQIP
tara:strand:- start:78 stop:569 length:492 start_codon:yes stop_codon:yes gene_type:complete